MTPGTMPTTDQQPRQQRGRVRDLSYLVAIAAAIWGTDALFRMPLTKGISAATVVFAEHVILVLVLAPWWRRSWQALRRAPLRSQLAVALVGIGASAMATLLFTMAFAGGDPITPVVVQKTQPLLVLIGAAILLKERLRPRVALFAVPALIGMWLLAFADPFDVHISRVSVVLLSLGAAALWAAGTVLGRLVSADFTTTELTTLRFGFGLIGAAVVVWATGTAWWVPDLASTGLVAALALVVGLLAMLLYYRGLRSTAAARAAIAELAFPVSAAVVGVVFLHKSLAASQWVGAVLLVASIAAMCWHESHARVAAIDSPQEPAHRMT